ncbi:MAG: HD domain-containing protein [bacterium]|nr:HD domain-containing protein [bacterium]
MDNSSHYLARLFHIAQLTRAQIQQGYLIRGIRRQDISNLAEHHYLVAFVAWQLTLLVEQAGGKIDKAKVLEFALIHDLGELLGGDIAMPYAQRNPKAREYAKAFEAENHKFLSDYFGKSKKHFEQLSEEILNASSDESRIAKIADYIELTHYLVYMESFVESDVALIEGKIIKMITEFCDQAAREALKEFFEGWKIDIRRLATSGAKEFL